MIRLDACREAGLYTKRLAETPERKSYFFDIPDSPFIYQYHSANGEIFGGVFAKTPDGAGAICAYLSKVDLN